MGLARGAARLAFLLCLALVSLPLWAGIEPGQPAPPLAAPDDTGQLLRLDDYRGQVVYIDFWASWCAPCGQALPAYERLYREWKRKGFAVIAVNVDRDRRAAQRMLQRIPVSFPVVYDPEGVWAERFALPTMPTGYLIDRAGQVRYVHVGYTPTSLPALEAEIHHALSIPP